MSDEAQSLRDADGWPEYHDRWHSCYRRMDFYWSETAWDFLVLRELPFFGTGPQSKKQI